MLAGVDEAKQVNSNDGCGHEASELVVSHLQLLLDAQDALCIDMERSFAHTKACCKLGQASAWCCELYPRIDVKQASNAW